MRSRVSVNILTKNRAGLLRRALASTFRQTRQPDEIVIINDGSTDETESVIHECVPSALLNYVHHKTSQGITRSRDEALRASTGEYIAVLDDDDEWIDERKLEKQVEFLDANPRIVLIGGCLEKSGKNVSRAKSDFVIRQTALMRNNFFTSTVMFRRAAAIEAGGFIYDGLDLNEDYDLWLRMGCVGGFHNLPTILARYQESTYSKDKMLQFYGKHLWLIDRQRNNYPYYRIAKTWVELRMRYLV